MVMSNWDKKNCDSQFIQNCAALLLTPFSCKQTSSSKFSRFPANKTNSLASGAYNAYFTTMTTFGVVSDCVEPLKI